MKAQIIRINHTTDIVPAGVYKLKDDQTEETQGFNEIEKVEEPVTQPLSFYWKLENWQHLTPEINCFGRVTPEEIEFTDPDLEDEAKDRIRADIRQIGKPKERLSPIVNDTGKLISPGARKMLAR